MRRSMLVALIALLISTAGPVAAFGQQAAPFVPEEGQPGKDVVWVPTPPALVEAMLTLAEVTPRDRVVDLGSGDGRNVIAAALRGARATGVEFNPELVELSRQRANAAGVGTRATFVQHDMFTYDFSQASVMALFLLPSNLLQLRPKLLALQPGSRIVSNTFLIQDWTPDATVTVDGPCESWCEAILWVVPAHAEGTWRFRGGTLALTQTYQILSGTLTVDGQATAVSGRLRGETFTLSADGRDYTGRVSSDRLELVTGSGASRTARTARRAPAR
jgi:SAM-dependent methyltransferase